MSAEPVAELGSVVLDVNDLETEVEFWKAVLGVGEARRFPGFVWLEPQGPGAPSLALQQVPEPRTGKNRMHLDFAVQDREAFVSRVEALGGSRVEDHTIFDFTWSVLADPEGNVFCVASH